MKNFLKILILSIVAIITFGGFSGVAFAETPAIEFETLPLFGESNFIPGQSVTRTIKFTNNTGIARNAYIQVAEVVNTDKFGDAVTLVIKQDDIILYNNTFSNFFNKGKVMLPQVKVGDTNIISLIATFIPESNNDYQNKVMGFGLQAVLEDVGVVNDTVSIGGQQSSGGGGSGFPMIIGPKNLIISGELASSNPMPQTGTILITWTTNIPASSQVVYGLVSGGSYTLDLTKTNFGYSLGTTETDISPKVMSHFITLSDLVPEQIYVYRVISRASPPTVSYEHTFMLRKDGTIEINPTLAVVVPINEQNNLGQQQGTGEVLGVNTSDIGGTAGNPNGTGNTVTSSTTATSSENTRSGFNQFATTFFGAGFLSWQFGLFLLLALLLILFIIWKRRRHDEDVVIK